MDKILTSVPVNGTAARVISKGSKYSKIRDKNILHWDLCPKLSRPLNGSLNLTGVKFGSFEVIGLLHFDREKRAKNKPARWVCRCSCGRYEARLAKTIKASNSSGDSCQECSNTSVLKAKYDGKPSQSIWKGL